MKPGSLQAAQVAALLLSASYGIGFLFGSGQQAVAHGMAGALYGVASAAGMLALAALAPALWRRGLAVWDLFAETLGERAGRVVAVLSLVWMSGVLAAQIQGAVAVAQLLGLGKHLALVRVVALVVWASRMALRRAANLFSACLLASAGVLVYALFAQGGVALLPGAPASFVAELPRLGWVQAGVMTLAISLLVCTGADYHQFLLAARSARSAALGCAVAALGLALLAFLPPALALAYLAHAPDASSLDTRQVVPAALAHTARCLVPGADLLMLAVLATAALGSGAAILRAMAQALASAAPPAWRAWPSSLRIAAVVPALLLAAREQGIVDTMVSVNAVYIATVGVTLVALLRGRAQDAAIELRVMAAGGAASAAAWIASGLGAWPGSGDLWTLGAGLGAAGVTALALRRRQRRRIGVPQRHVVPGP